MKTIQALAGAFLLSQAASAVVVPDGTVQAFLCGSLNKSTEICLSSVAGSKRTYLTVTPFKREATSVRIESSKAVGPTTHYVAYAWNPNTSKDSLETKYEIVLKTATRTGQMEGKYLINGKQVGSDFEMGPIYHPAAAP